MDLHNIQNLSSTVILKPDFSIRVIRMHPPYPSLLFHVCLGFRQTLEVNPSILQIQLCFKIT